LFIIKRIPRRHYFQYSNKSSNIYFSLLFSKTLSVDISVLLHSPWTAQSTGADIPWLLTRPPIGRHFTTPLANLLPANHSCRLIVGLYQIICWQNIKWRFVQVIYHRSSPSNFILPLLNNASISWENHTGILFVSPLDSKTYQDALKY